MRHSGTEQDKCHKRGVTNPLICGRSLPRNRQESHGFALRAPNGAGNRSYKTASPAKCDAHGAYVPASVKNP